MIALMGDVSEIQRRLFLDVGEVHARIEGKMTRQVWMVLNGMVMAQAEAGLGKFFTFTPKAFRAENPMSPRGYKMALAVLLGGEVVARRIGKRATYVMDPALFVRAGGAYFERMAAEYKSLLVMCSRQKANKYGIVPDEGASRRALRFQAKGKAW